MTLRMRGWMRNGVGALLLSTAIASTGFACAGSPSEESAESGADLTAAEATTALSALIAHPESNLGGVGNSVSTITGKTQTWTLYPYQPSSAVTSATASKNVANGNASVFLVIGSGGAIFLTDLATGACAGAAPPGVDLGKAGAALGADIAAQNAAPTTQSLHVQGGLGWDLLADAAGKRVWDVLASAGAKIADSRIATVVVSATKDAFTNTVAFFSKSAEKATTDAVEGSATKKAADALGKLGEAADGKVEVKVVKAETSAPVSVLRATDEAVLKGKTSGAVATTLAGGVKLIEAEPASVWPIGEQLSFLTELEAPSGARAVVGPLSAADQKILADNGYKQALVLPSSEVPAIAAGTSKVAIPKDALIVEALSDGAGVSIREASGQYVLPFFDEATLALPDAQFVKEPVVQATRGFLNRLFSSSKDLPKITVAGDGASKVPQSLMQRAIARAVALLKNMGVNVRDAGASTLMMNAVSGYVPDGSSDGGISTTFPTLDAGAGTSTATTLPSGDDDSSSAPAAAPDETSDAPLAHKAAAGGCSSVPGNAGGDVGALALGLAVVLVARRRRN